MPFLATIGNCPARARGILLPSTGYPFFRAISANTQNYNVRSRLLSAGWNGTTFVDATVLINSGVTLGSSSTANPSFDTGSLPTNSIVTLINNGIIAGCGGSGGDASASVGGNGGNAINFQINGIVINNNIIGSGGGGGGGGASYTGALGGSGGGGGAGDSVGSGGASATGSVLNGNAGAAGTLTTGGLGGSSASVDAPDQYSVSASQTLFAYQSNLTYTVTLNRTTYVNITLNIPFTSTIGSISSGTTSVTIAAGTNSATATVTGSSATSGGTYTTSGNTQQGLTFTGSNITMTMFGLIGIQSAAGCYSAQGGLTLEPDASGQIWLRMGNWPTDPPNCQTCDWNWLRNNFATNSTRTTNNTRPYWTHTWSFRVDDITVGNSSDTRDPAWPYTLVGYTYRVTRTGSRQISIAIYPNSWGTGDTGTSRSVSEWWTNVNNICPIVFNW